MQTFFSQLSIVVFTAILIKKCDVLHDSAMFSMLVNSNNLKDAVIQELYYWKAMLFIPKIIFMLK